jgi:hypothetical protein
MRKNKDGVEHGEPSLRALQGEIKTVSPKSQGSGSDNPAFFSL